MSAKFDALMFESFLKKLIRHRARDKRMVAALEKARHHHAVLLKPLLKKYRKVMTLLFLPPYSPQLAPIERFGNSQVVRQHTIAISKRQKKK